MSEHWIADRMRKIDASGIRKVFDLAATMTDPINLSIGQPDFPTPEPVQQALCQAVKEGKTGYSQTQGIAPLLQRLQADINAECGHADRQVFISSGTSGALMLALCTLVGPDDEVIVFDPWFVMYKHLTTLTGGKVVEISTYPDFRIDVEKVAAAITDRTKVIICNSPGNPTGYVPTSAEIQSLAELCRDRDIALISDEIYRTFTYDADRPFVSPTKWYDKTIVIDGFSKSHSMTGLRLGFCHGPQAIIQQMLKLQQFTFVCAPHPVQWAGLSALDYDVTPHVDDYRKKRDFLVGELQDDFEIAGGSGAFYLFLKTPWGTGTEFVTAAVQQNLLIIPGNVFSPQDTHFRLSYATSDQQLQRGAEVLKKLARQGPPQS